MAVGAAKAGADTTLDSIIEWARANKYAIDDSAVAGLKGYMAGKSAVIDAAFAIDPSKSFDVNVARVTGAVAAGAIVGIGGIALTGTALGAFVVGVGVTVGLKYMGLDPADVTEKAYNAAKNAMDKYSQYQQSLGALDPWNNASPEDRANYIKNGGLPFGYTSSSARRIDPLALDLNHDGTINTISLSSSTTFFDMDNNGMSELSGWIAPTDGMLVYDKNNDGKIDSNNEMFGKATKDGFTELKERGDTNNDNVFDANDTLYNTLKVWTDTNSDGISQEGELHTLSELNITSINLSKTTTNTNSEGNTIIATSTFTQDGQTYNAGAVALAANNMVTDYRGEYELTLDTLFMPWLRGYGDVKDSQIAYSLDEGFREYAAELMSDPTRAYNEFDTYLAKWSGLDAMWTKDSVAHSALTMDDKVWMMESFVGANLYKSSIEAAYANKTNSSNSYNTAYVDAQYAALKQRYYAIFAAQSFYADAFEGSYYSVNQDKFVVTDAEVLNAAVAGYVNHVDLYDVIVVSSILKQLNDNLGINIDTLASTISDASTATMISDILSGKVTPALFVANYSGTSGNDFVIGGSGNDTISTSDGNDTIMGGTGNDYLNGSWGADTYIFNRGDGQDTIYDYSESQDVLKFGEGISRGDVAFCMNGSNLSIEYGATDKITVTNQSNSSYAIERFELNDGSYMTNSDINQLIQNITSYATANGIAINNVDAVRANNDLMNIIASSWHQA